MTSKTAILTAALLLASCGPAGKPTSSPPSSSPAPPVLPSLAADRDGFWKNEKLVVTRPVNGLLQVAIVRVLAERTYEIHPAPMREYHAIPLAAYLATRPDIGSGEHLVVTNIRGEQLYLRTADIAKHAPVIVIGIDEERNLFRIATGYQLQREYTWRETPPPPKMTRPVGAFLFFPNGEPPEIEDTTLAGFGLTPASFRFTKDDPLARIRSLSPELRDALSGRDGCLKCHSLHGAGARAHHVRANDGQPHGGFALPLEEYTRDVLQRFLFDQDTVAASFGVDPLHIDPPTANALFEMISVKK
jgi:hypothetical protein